jgi:hydroxymethylbilane synthase
MIPAPAQGAMLVVAMQDDNLDAGSHLNDIRNRNSNLQNVNFLKLLKGCTAPIETLAAICEDEDTIHFQGVLFRLTERKIENG